LIPPEYLFLLDLAGTFAPYIIITLSLNLEYGYGGIPNFGKALAVACGAFVAGFFPGRLAAELLNLGAGFDPMRYIRENSIVVTEINRVLASDALFGAGLLTLTLILAIVIGALLGLLVFYSFVKLRAEFLAMVLLAAAEVLLLIGYNYPPLVGGTLGVSLPDPFIWAGEYRFVAVTIFLLIMAVAVFLYVHKLMKSPLGRLLKAVRDDENAALAFGKDVTKIRMKAFVTSSAIASLGGALYAFYTGSVIAIAYNRVSWTFWPWVMVILGGAANNVGVVLGTFTFVAVRKLIIRYKYQLSPFLPFDVVWLDMLLLGIALLFILLYRPEGLIPEKPVRTLSLEKLMKYVGPKPARKAGIPISVERVKSILKKGGRGLS